MQINETLPEISLEGYQNGQITKFDLSKTRGKWLVLVFYPADFTFICPTELEEIADLYPEFQKEDAEIMSVSTDTAFVHKAWHDHSKSINKVKFPMLADPTGQLCKALNTYIASGGLSLRGSFIFNPEGLLKTLEIHDNSVGRSAEELLRKLQACKFTHENPGLVCPASWKKGAKSLKPGVDLIGKI